MPREGDVHHDGQGAMRLHNGARWDGHYMITVRTDAAASTRTAFGLFMPRWPAEPIFLIAHGDKTRATLVLQDGREVETTIRFNGAASVDLISFEQDPFPA